MNAKKLLALTLALLTLISCLAACGGSNETESTADVGPDSGTESDSMVETEDPRQSVKIDLPEGLSFADRTDNTVTFFTRDDNELWKNEIDVTELTDDTLYDAIYRRNRAVEEKLGVVIKTIQQNGNFNKRNEWNQTLRNAVNTRSGDFDAAAIYMSTGSALAVEGMYYNLLDFPNLSLEKPWWNQNIQQEITLFDTLYYLAGDVAITETAAGFCMFYNKDLFSKYYAEDNVDLYTLVMAGEWTIDKLYELVEPVWEDVNSSGEADDGDVLGFIETSSLSDGSKDSWMAGLGVDITTMKDGIPTLTFYNERTVSAFEKVQKLCFDNPGSLFTDKKALVETTFINGAQMFERGMLNSGSAFRDIAFEYGCLPMPKYDTDQKSYRTICENTASLIVVLSSCPAEKTDMVGATLELMAAESYKNITPLYYDVVLKSKYSNSPEDAAIYDLILESFTYSFGYCYSSMSLSGVGGLFRHLEADLAQQYQANEQVYYTSLETLIDKLDDIAFSMQYGN